MLISFGINPYLNVYLRQTMFKFSTLFVTVEELGNKVFGFLRNNIIPEPLVHDVIILLPVFHNFFQVLLTLK